MQWPWEILRLCADAKDYFVPEGAENVNFNDIEVKFNFERRQPQVGNSLFKFTILMLSGPFMAPVPTPKLNQHAMQLILEAVVLRALSKEQVPKLSD